LTLTKRPVWLLDEPATALDEEGQNLLWSLCRAHLDQDGVLLIATHAPLPLPSIRLDLGTTALHKETA
jgi:heme exporter protein A